MFLSYTKPAYVCLYKYYYNSVLSITTELESIEMLYVVEKISRLLEFLINCYSQKVVFLLTKVPERFSTKPSVFTMNITENWLQI